MFIPKSAKTISKANIGLPVSYLANPVFTGVLPAVLIGVLFSFAGVALCIVLLFGTCWSTMTVTVPVPFAE